MDGWLHVGWDIFVLFDLAVYDLRLKGYARDDTSKGRGSLGVLCLGVFGFRGLGGCSSGYLACLFLPSGFHWLPCPERNERPHHSFQQPAEASVHVFV